MKPLEKKTIGFLGAGNMAEALIKGLINSGAVAPGRIAASDKSSARTAHVAEAYDIKVLSKNYEVVRNADIIFLTVKPNDVRGLLKEVAPEFTSDKLLISAAAGITTATILGILKEHGPGGFVPVVRAMPNTPALVGAGATGLCAGIGAGGAELKLAKAVFESVGKVVIVEDEPLLDAVTGLSGSGPAYVFLFMEALSEAGVKAGLPSDTARTLAIQTTLGAALLALESPKSLEELRRMVTSPGGTTIEGLKRFDEAGFNSIVESAVMAAARRAKELSAGS